MARTERQSAPPSRGVTPAQLREAERGLRLTLAATFSSAWIAQNVRDVLAEANAEYAEWLQEHGPARNPTGWLIERGRLRALNLVVRENRRSGPPLDSVVHSFEDPDPTPEETALEHDRHRRIAEALSRIPEKDRKLLALVYFEGHSIRAAGRLLGWGKSNADYHHAEAMKRLRALVGPRDLLSPALVGLVAQATALRDRGRLVGGITYRISAALQDFTDRVARAFGSATRSAGDAARRAAPLTDTGTAAVSGSGAGRLIAQCGVLATAAICGAILISPVEHGVKALLPHEHSGSSSAKRDRSSEPSNTAERSATVTPAAVPLTEEPSRSSAAARLEEARRIEERRQARRRQERARRHRRRERISRARRARKAQKARAKASRVKRNEAIEAAEAPEEVAPEVSEPAPEPEAVVPEAQSAPPPATGGQTREEFGL